MPPLRDGLTRLEDLAQRRALLAEQLQQAEWRRRAGLDAEEPRELRGALQQVETELRLIAGAS
jgi:hypothetical protein